jgi:GDP-L-fucose synthase
MDSKARIFVAGHHDVNGAAVKRLLLQEGYKNVITRDKSHLDLVDARTTDNFFTAEKPEYVVVAAGLSGGIVENQRIPADFLHINLSVAVNILRAAHEYGVKKLIYLCSSCMYPSACPQPMKEEQLLTGKPDASSLPTAISKLAALQLCLAYNQQYGTKRFIPVIPNNSYGPDDDFSLSSGHVLAALIHRFHEAKRLGLPAIELWGSGTPRREFIHADDVAGACLMLLKKPVDKMELPLNIGTGQDHSINDLAQMIARTVGYTGKITWDTKKPDGAPQKLLDSSRLRELGWTPAISLEQGIKETYQWFLSNNTQALRRGA